MNDKKRRERNVSELTLQIESSTMAEKMRSKDDRDAALVVIGGMDVGNTIPLAKDSVVLGRDPDCDEILRDDGISRQHAEVVREKSGGYLIRDLGSTNGIFVEGERVAQHRLRDGDKVLLGRRTVIKFSLQDEIEAEYQQQMYSSAVRDGLTGAFNRRYFDERVTAELSHARRHLSPVSVLMIDLDHFKRVNDTFGHVSGDQVLEAVAKSIAETIRTEDVFARYGGEEFVIIAREIDEVGGLAFGERLRRIIEQIKILAPNGERIPVTISVGVATVPQGAEYDSAEVISRADQNLYSAKEKGRNRVEASALRRKEDD
ncbi:MAG: GGDEF domain-containing protein [Deltaproteobacteria bacterium]|nr:GGDEF domain-containing protein [Deltaproteobacteria bacterium]